MFRLLTNWIRKRLGHHVCEEFTRWERREQDFLKTHEWDDVFGETRVLPKPQKYTRVWQERQCTICGKIEQQSLEQ